MAAMAPNSSDLKLKQVGRLGHSPRGIVVDGLILLFNKFRSLFIKFKSLFHSRQAINAWPPIQPKLTKTEENKLKEILKNGFMFLQNIILMAMVNGILMKLILD